MSASCYVKRSGTVIIPSNDQSLNGISEPKVISLARIFKEECTIPLSSAKFQITKVRFDTSLAVPHRVFAIAKRNGAPALTTPYSTLSSQIPGSDSVVVASVDARDQQTGTYRVSMEIDGKHLLHYGVTEDDKHVSDLIFVIAFDKSSKQLQDQCGSDIAGSYAVEFVADDAARVATETAAVASKASFTEALTGALKSALPKLTASQKKLKAAAEFAALSKKKTAGRPPNAGKKTAVESTGAYKKKKLVSKHAKSSSSLIHSI